MNRFGAKLLLFACVLGLVSPQCSAACFSGHPSVSAEIVRSRSVVIGTVAGARNVMDDPKDPSGITRTVYTLNVNEVLSGRSDSQIRLVSENTSSRFPMDVGKRYVVFVNFHGSELFVDSCGNSGALPKANNVVKKVRDATSRSRRIACSGEQPSAVFEVGT